MRLILSILMIAAVIAGFALFIVPKYGAIKTLRAQADDYNQILSNAKKLQQERNRLVEKYNAFDPQMLAKLNAMLPTNPQNVKLILELDAMASRFGMLLQNVKIESDAQAAAARPGAPASNTDIGTLPITFSVVGPYDGFVPFLRAMESSLRIIDAGKIAFTAVDERPNYQFTVGIKTYWLK